MKWFPGMFSLHLQNEASVRPFVRPPPAHGYQGRDPKWQAAPTEGSKTRGLLRRCRAGPFVSGHLRQEIDKGTPACPLTASAPLLLPWIGKGRR